MAAASPDKNSRVAYAEDIDANTGKSIEGSRQYAAVRDDDGVINPVKSRRKSSTSYAIVGGQSGSSSAAASYAADSDSTRSSQKSGANLVSKKPSDKDRSSHSKKSSKQNEPDRERRTHDKKPKDKPERSATDHKAAAIHKEASNSRKTRPHVLEHANSVPNVPQVSPRRHAAEASSAYVYTPASSRPGAQRRPESYYSGQPSLPPVSNMGWHPSGFPPAPYQMHPSQLSMYANPPQSPLGPSHHYDMHAGSMAPRDLKSRFDVRQPPVGGTTEPVSRRFDQEQMGDEDAPQIARRTSRREADDRRNMPPPKHIPSRVMSALPSSTPFAPPPPSRSQARPHVARVPSSQRHSFGYSDDHQYDYPGYDQDQEFYHDGPTAAAYYGELDRPRRHSLLQRAVDVVPASGRSRRASIYGPGGHTRPMVSFEQESLEDKYRDAMAYQDAVTGGPKTPLTAETLRKASRHGVPSSRSTRSSESRDESEHRRSYTTGLTRSSSGNGDDVTIKVGSAVLRVQGNTEITLNTRPTGSRTGSDRASTVYQIEDGRGRSERKALPLRTRASSQSDSYSRGYTPTVYSRPEPVYQTGNYF